jgi:hypothetical protein
MKQSYEYNDETYESVDEGNATIAFPSRDLAVKKCNELNIKSFFEDSYIYEYRNFTEIFSINVDLKIIFEKYNLDYNSYINNAKDFFNMLTKEELLIFVDRLRANMYSIEEIEMENEN